MGLLGTLGYSCESAARSGAFRAGPATRERASAEITALRLGPKGLAQGTRLARHAREASGGQGRNRTSDTRIFSAVLYQLSYLAPVNCKRRPKRRSSISKGFWSVFGDGRAPK